MSRGVIKLRPLACPHWFLGLLAGFVAARCCFQPFKPDRKPDSAQGLLGGTVDRSRWTGSNLGAVLLLVSGCFQLRCWRLSDVVAAAFVFFQLVPRWTSRVPVPRGPAGSRVLSQRLRLSLSSGSAPVPPPLGLLGGSHKSSFTRLLLDNKRVQSDGSVGFLRPPAEPDPQSGCRDTMRAENSQSACWRQQREPSPTLRLPARRHI